MGELNLEDKTLVIHIISILKLTKVPVYFLQKTLITPFNVKEINIPTKYFNLLMFFYLTPQ